MHLYTEEDFAIFIQRQSEGFGGETSDSGWGYRKVCDVQTW